MDIHITNHACVRYLERSLKLNLDKIKCKKLTDSDILDMLCINKNDPNNAMPTTISLSILPFPILDIFFFLFCFFYF